jgi:hypothetical protein
MPQGDGGGGGLTFGVISAGCVRERKGGISNQSPDGRVPASEGANIFGDGDRNPLTDGGRVTSELIAAVCGGAMVQRSVEFGFSDAAPIEELPAGLLWRLMVVGAGGGG